MNRITLIILILISNSPILYGQKNYAYYDSLTYRLYTQEKWDSVQTIGEEAINQNIDYYYLRMRIGISYFKKNAYSQAIQHFQKANEFNSTETALEYIYYSYLYSGNTREAMYFSKKLSPSFIDNNKINLPHFMDEVSIEIISSTFTNWDEIKRINTPPSEPNNYRLEKEITGPYISYGLNLKHEINNKWTWVNQLSFYDVKSYQQLYFDQSIKNQNDFDLKEYHYYTYFTNWKQEKSITYYGHFSYLNAEMLEYNFLHPVIAPPPLPPVTTYIYEIKPMQLKLFNYVLGYNNTHYYKKSNLIFNLEFAKIIDDYIAISGLSYRYSVGKYGFGKSQVMASVDLSVKGLNGYFEQSLGAVLFKHVIAKVTADIGRIRNISNIDGSVIYNLPYTINSNLAGMLQYSVNKYLSIYATYIFQNNSHINVFYGFDGYNKQGKAMFSTINESYQFSNKIISGGILWNF